jgi:hypothetical protein
MLRSAVDSRISLCQGHNTVLGLRDFRARFVVDLYNSNEDIFLSSLVLQSQRGYFPVVVSYASAITPVA